MNEFDLIVRFKSDEDSITLRNYIIDHLFEDKLFDNLQMWDFRRSEVLSILNLRKENTELKAKIKQIIERERVVPEHYLCEMIEKNKKLKAQIEKMKCCENCKTWRYLHENEECPYKKDRICDGYLTFGFQKWEQAEWR